MSMQSRHNPVRKPLARKRRAIAVAIPEIRLDALVLVLGILLLVAYSGAGLTN